MKIPRLLKSKKTLSATARRASASGMDFEGIPEPNMKLSRALLIVLLLHVVAVSGIIAFNAIKTRESTFVPANSPQTETAPTETASAANHANTDKAHVVPAQKENAQHTEVRPSHSPVKETHVTSPASSGKTYVVKKGDVPVTIAKRLKVSYDDLMELNHISDPRKLQIGQKLLIPKTPVAKPEKKKNKK